MGTAKKTRIRATPPADFQVIESLDDLEKLSEIYAKLTSVTAVFSNYKNPDKDQIVNASEIYGFWFIFRDICEDLADILKLKKW
jgi:hypothetical protein